MKERVALRKVYDNMKIHKEALPGKEFGGVCESSNEIPSTTAHHLRNFDSMRSSTTRMTRDFKTATHVRTMEDEVMECVLCFAVMETLRKDTRGDVFQGTYTKKVTRKAL
jgi:hypothetical protein